MRRSLSTLSWVFSALAVVAGCESNKDGSTAGVIVSGSVDDAVDGEGRTAALVWMVISASPDYGYKFGEATIANGRFSIVLAGDPPAEAINSFGVGVAVVVVPKPGVTWPDGKLAERDLVPVTSGLSARYSVIWRVESLDLGDAGVKEEVTWPLQFPAGFSCGICVPALAGSTFDGFSPHRCDQLRIDTYVAEEVCNWT
jgi:hypothetical protein